MGDFPSGQRGQTVNLLAMPSVVRIHHLPPGLVTDIPVGHFFFVTTSIFGLFATRGRMGDRNLSQGVCGQNTQKTEPSQRNFTRERLRFCVFPPFSVEFLRRFFRQAGFSPPCGRTSRGIGKGTCAPCGGSTAKNSWTRRTPAATRSARRNSWCSSA